MSLRLDKAVQSIPEGGRVGLAVYDLTDNRWLYLCSSGELLSLASTTKLLSTVAAYHFLGPTYQFSTRVLALGPVSQGSIPGLGVIGGGDPCLDTHFYPQPETPFRQWAARLRQLGISRIHGDVLIDNRLFSGPIRPASYPQDAENLQRWYSAPAAAFAWNDDCIEVRTIPNLPGHPAEVEVRPVSPLIQIHNLTRSLAGHGDPILIRDAATNAVTVSGSCGQASAWKPVCDASDPDLLAGSELTHVLTQEGITIDGAVRLGPVDPTSGTLVIDQRHDLQAALELMNQDSQNFYAEQFLRLVGAHRFGVGSIEAGCAAVPEALAALLGKDTQAVALLDGSGLSYGNRASAGLMAKIMIALARTPIGKAFAATLHQGYDGRANACVKTGTHAEACCLVGYIDLENHHRIAFASLLNRARASSFEDWSPRLRKEIFSIIAESAER